MSVDATIVAVGDVAFQQMPAAATLTACSEWSARWRDAGPCGVFGNLELPLTSRGTPADKPVALRGPPDGAGALRSMGFDLVSLANNHALDYGPQGLRDTMAALDAAGVTHVGAGVGKQAYRAEIRTLGGARVAFVAFSSTLPRGWAAAVDRLGVAPLRVHQSVYLDGALQDEQPGTALKVSTWPDEPDLRRAADVVEGLKREGCDLVIAALHWGVPPMWLAPYQGALADYQRPMAERLIHAGCDAIVGHHAHVPLPHEFVDGVPVCYSLGNFYFPPFALEHPQEGPITPGLMEAPPPPDLGHGTAAVFRIHHRTIASVEVIERPTWPERG